MTNRGKSPGGVFIQSPRGVFGKEAGEPPPTFGTWFVTAANLFEIPGPVVEGYRLADCFLGQLSTGQYKSVAMSAQSASDVLPKTNAQTLSLHALGDRSGYVYTFTPPYTCNFVNSSVPEGLRPIDDWPGYVGEFLPFHGWELFDADNVAQSIYTVPRINDYDLHDSNDDITWYDAALIPNDDDLIDLSAPWTCTGIRSIPANTGGPGNIGSRVDCTLDVFPEEMWGVNLTATAPGYIGWASFRFRNLRATGQTNGTVYDCDNRPPAERYLCGGGLRNVLDQKYPAFPGGQAYPYEQIQGIGGANDPRIDDIEIIIPKSAEPAQPFDLGETVFWDFQP